MTIRSNVNIRELNQQLSDFQSCASESPEGTYEDAKTIADGLEEIFSDLYSALLSQGFKKGSDDQFREIEALIYGYVKGASPELFSTFAVSEGFGKWVENPETRERVLNNCIRDRDFIAQMKVA